MVFITDSQRVKVLAALAGLDVRTVQKFLAGGRIRSPIDRERLVYAERLVEKLQAAAELEEPRAP